MTDSTATAKRTAKTATAAATGDDGGEDSDVLRSNVRKLLKLAGVVASEDSVKRVLDRARQGLSSLSDLIREEVGGSGG